MDSWYTPFKLNEEDIKFLIDLDIPKSDEDSLSVFNKTLVIYEAPHIFIKNTLQQNLYGVNPLELLCNLYEKILNLSKKYDLLLVSSEILTSIEPENLKSIILDKKYKFKRLPKINNLLSYLTFLAIKSNNKIYENYLDIELLSLRFGFEFKADYHKRLRLSSYFEEKECEFLNLIFENSYNHKFKSELKSRNLEIETLTNSLESKEKDNKSLNCTIQASYDEINEIQKNLAELVNVNADFENKKNEIFQFKNELKNSQEKIFKLKDQIKELQDINTNTLHEVNNLQKKILLLINEKKIMINILEKYTKMIDLSNTIIHKFRYLNTNKKNISFLPLINPEVVSDK